MDIEVNETGEHAPGTTAQRVGRRALLGAGFGGAALSLLPLLSGRASASTPPTGDTAEAATTTTAAPLRPTEEDVTLLGDAQRAELAAVTLFDQAIAMGGRSDVQLTVVSNLREAHNAYANALSGLLGRQAPGTASEAVVTLYTDGFNGASAGDMLDAAYELESALVATHTEILGSLVGTNGASLLASIQVNEARHGTVLADLNEKSDPADLLVDKEADSLVGKV